MTNYVARLKIFIMYFGHKKQNYTHIMNSTMQNVHGYSEGSNEIWKDSNFTCQSGGIRWVILWIFSPISFSVVLMLFV